MYACSGYMFESTCQCYMHLYSICVTHGTGSELKGTYTVQELRAGN